jgi:hypothetical protein
MHLLRLVLRLLVSALYAGTGDAANKVVQRSMLNGE